MLRRWSVLLGIGLLLCVQGIEATQVVRRFVLAAGRKFWWSETHTFALCRIGCRTFCSCFRDDGWG